MRRPRVQPERIIPALLITLAALGIFWIGWKTSSYGKGEPASKVVGAFTTTKTRVIKVRAKPKVRIKATTVTRDGTTKVIPSTVAVTSTAPGVPVTVTGPTTTLIHTIASTTTSVSVTTITVPTTVPTTITETTTETTTATS